jgi:two-component system response regulator HydG
VDVRLIAATHRDLEEMVASHAFREDLFYRLNVAVVRVPPLRERSEDVELLAVHFLRDCVAASRRDIRGVTTEALEALSAYGWPGNVRQLRGAIERACVVARGQRVEVGDLPPEVISRPNVSVSHGLVGLTWSQALERGRADVAREYLEAVLRKYDGQVSEAAAHAAIERESFYRLIRRYGVDSEAIRSEAVRSKK